MKQLKKILLVSLYIGLLSANTTFAKEESDPELLSAGELLQGCEAGDIPGAPNQYCMRYVFGLVQTILSLQQAEQSTPLFCIDPQVTRLEAATDAVMAYLRNQAARAAEDAQVLVVEALSKNYPCSNITTGHQI